MVKNFLMDPLKKVDERIHRQYEKFSSKLDKMHPKMRYAVPALFDFLGFHNFKNMLFGFGSGFAVADLAITGYSFLNGLKSNEDVSDSKVKDHPLVEMYLSLSKVVRTPFFLVGTTFLGKSIYDVSNTFLTGEPLPDYFSDVLSDGAGLLYLSSSMFVRDKNYSLLEKKPLLKKAKGGLEKITDIVTPEPLPDNKTFGDDVLSNYGRIR